MVVKNFEDNNTWPFESSPNRAEKLNPSGEGPRPGTLLKQRYLIERELGRGGIGVVYLGRDLQLLSKPVVIKFLLDRSGEKVWYEKKFRQEIEALSRLDHPAVIGILDAGEMSDGRLFLVMQFVEGISLRSALTSEQITLQRLANIMRQTGQAVSAAHDKGIFHRDLKPENIMLQSLGEGEEQVKVIDFGVARVKDSQVASNKETTGVPGTVAYMAPEQLMGKPTAASDIYAMGVIVYEIVTGRRPFNPESPFQLLEMQRAGLISKLKEFRPDLPDAAEDVILKALSFDPADRWSRARQFGNELSKALSLNGAFETSAARNVEPHAAVATTVELSHHAGISNGALPKDKSRANSTLPSGTVTFLFTDIEGSTRLWEQYPERMSAVLARHDSLLRNAVEAHGGAVFKTVGDAFCVAFASASDALAAANSAQRAIHLEPWGEIGPLRVRMALHTGTAELRDGDYFGSTVNRVARLLAAGHGGQTLLSQTTCALVRSALPENNSVRDLGDHRLKDLQYPERIFQVVAADLPVDFPPLKTLENRANNLPLQPTELIGRETEAEALEQLLRDEPPAGAGHHLPVRLLTVTGPGGTGKTRLALEVAASLIDAFEGGVFLVSLAPIKDPDLVVSAIARTLGLKEIGGQQLIENLRDYLTNQQILLLLDNFEHVLNAAPLMSQLLADCPRVKVLVTSRAALHLRGEYEFPLSPLAVPDPTGGVTLETLSRNSAVALFVQRALAVKPDFLLTNENARSIAEICIRLDGLPLAIELAAARIKYLPPKAMLLRLENRLKVLTDGARDLPARQQTMRSAIAWSYDLLDSEEKELFRKISVFVGGCTLDSIEPVCWGDSNDELDVLDRISSLVDKSLIRQEEQSGGEPRFLMLETIREYGLECLAASGQAQETFRAHASYFLNLAQAAEPELTGPRQVQLLEMLEREHDNLRAALRWSQQSGQIEVALQLSGSLWRFWKGRGHLSEGRVWLALLLGLADRSVSESTRAKALRAQGILARMQGDYDTARGLIEEGLSLYRDLDDKQGIALSLDSLGTVLLGQDDYERAAGLLQESLELRREIGDRLGIANSLSNLAIVIVTYQQGDYARAKELCEESLVLYRELQCEWGIATSLNNLGAIANQQGDREGAKALFIQSLVVFQDLGDKAHIAICLEGLAAVACAQRDLEKAATLLGAAKAFSEAAKTPLPLYMSTEHECSLSALRTGLNEHVFKKAWAEGEAMTMTQAIAYASNSFATASGL